MTRPLVSPDVVRSKMRRIRLVAADLDALARVVAEAYEEAYDASLSSGSREGVPPGKSGFRVTDPTGDVATSGVHARMRWRVRDASSKVEKAISRLGGLRKLLEETEDVLVEAFAETDPEVREKLRRLRELEAAAIGD